MSRKIKFRAWDKQWGKMLLPEEFAMPRIQLDGSLYDDFGDPINDRDYIIEQYTGLKDKNGKEIYEGDIVKAKIQGFWATGTNTITEGKATWNLEVIYNDIRYMDVFHILGSKNQPGRIYYLFDEAISDIEVIGNIHENKELLGGEK